MIFLRSNGKRIDIMKNKNADPMALLEWEFFDWPLSISYLRCLDGIYALPSDCQLTITRGADYRLTGQVSGIIADKKPISYRGGEEEPLAGEFMETERIAGTKTGWENVLLTGVILGGHQMRGAGVNPDPRYQFEAVVRINELEYTINDYSDDETDKVLEFYLCGQTQLFWPRTTERKELTRTAKIRIGVDEEIDEPINISQQGNGSSSDYLLIDTPGHRIFVQQVDKIYLPDWSQGLLFEYRRKDGTIPGEEERKAIAEFTGFLLGTQLLKIGETHLDAGELVGKKVAYTPWGDNVVSKCSSPARPPVRIGFHEDRGKIEKLLNQLLPVYLEKRKAYNLKDVLWKNWIARELAVGTNLPVLSSGLETLAESYVKSNGLTRTYTKDEKSQYKDLIVGELDALKTKLSGLDYQKRVIDKLENPFNIGVGEKLKLFFQQLGFEFNNKHIETQAMQARNAMTHGALDSTSDEIRRYILLSHAYESLFNRVLLKTLGYKGDYIDYSALGHPSLAINRNLIGRTKS
jgi:hypothetical protein